MGNRLQGKTAIVLGAGCIQDDWGNGNAAAVTFAREGANVVAVDIEAGAAERTARLIREEGGNAVHCQADVASLAQLDAAVTLALDTYGSVDILHNNVGINALGGPVEVDEAQWDRVLAVNLKGAMLACKAVIPHMQRQGGGAIIQVSSIAAITWTGHPFLAYHTSKAGMNQLVRMVAVQHGPDNIRCNGIMPGLIDSPRIYGNILSMYGGDVEKMRKARSANVPLRRMGEVWDIAHAAVYLASDEARYVTGTVLAVDGGVTCTMAH